MTQASTTNKNELEYLNSLRSVLRTGKPVQDRTGVGTIRKLGLQTRYDLQDGFPLLTTKKIDLKSVSSELIWFIEGSGDERRLAELRFGKPRAKLTDKKTIWTANAHAPYWKPKAGFEGDLGRVYGVQWRNWTTPVQNVTPPKNGRTVTSSIYGAGAINPMRTVETDQLAQLIEGLKKDPYGRRHILTAWNPGELDQMALPPCHVLTQYFVEEGRLSCMLYQRSVDKFLGEPYNIASYALMTHMLAIVCGYDVGELIHVQGDAHIYSNHIEAVQEQLSREPRSAPRLIIDKVERIEDFTVDSFRLVDYDPHPAIKAEMAV
jgi:thymidylate synthase